ncbi:MAG: bifunctional diaminohydroxyphosphoribosylaminopyrimidine deaminase/5-amino-6-(5-phosphoribosylamino)uracil reductase RibD [Flavobacteriaceae bacterium]|nr:bifunctional diaminohydroxyphosphoribosylaminopyrimidine deaminase/5-amino-6-(5-phosphoribosylamino)uracil reductase RibD [Flavobacteriaceae bacterium]
MGRDEMYMARCIQLGKHALGVSRPNPMVGSLLVYKDRIIGEGFTKIFGGAHAEVNAIDSVKHKHLIADSTLYVTLEPCSHYGKTPPCVDLILTYGIRHVVIGCEDPNPKVGGQGIEKLKASGCEVKVGVLKNQVTAHHRRFLTYQLKKRPYIILKWARTRNGFFTPESRKNRSPVWISNRYTRQLVHKWRSEEQAILVGTQTVKDDDPGLNVRLWTGQDPAKVIIDRKQALETDLNIFNDSTPTIISEKTVEFDEHLARNICKVLYDMKITSIIIEGGARTLNTFIKEDLWDEARVITGLNEFESGIKAPEIPGVPANTLNIAGDILKYYYND